MLLTWALFLYCCLRLIPLTFSEACSLFPNDICCSFSHSVSVTLDQDSASTIKPTMAESGTMNDTLPKSLRILCFGDSLTAGYTSYGWEFYPYADHLRVGLQNMLATSDIEVDVDGRSGDQVRASYLPRIKRKCADTEKSYDWIIVMGGTNDLAWGQPPDTIYEGLRKLHCHCIIFPPLNLQAPRWPSPVPLCTSSLSAVKIFQYTSFINSICTEEVWKVALDTGANVLALNVLEAAASGDRANSRRNTLNDKIANHQQEK